MWIKIHYNLNTFTGYKFSNFATFAPKIKVKVNIIKAPVRFEPMT